MSIGVFILDDHEVVRRGLRELLESTPDFEVVGESGSAREAARRIPALHPHVAIYDVRLPDGSGIEACRSVRAIDPTIAGLVLTSYDDARALEAAVIAGASGYLLKDIRGNGLVDAVRRVAAGEQLLDEEQVLCARRAWGARSEEDPRLRMLTAQERRVLDGVAQGKTNHQIGDELSIAEKTVKNYVTSVLGKLGMERRTQAAVYVATHAHHGRR